MSQPNCRERRLDWIRGSQVSPVLGREVVEGQQLVAILPQTVAGLLVLGVVLLQELIEGRLGIGFRLRLG